MSDGPSVARQDAVCKAFGVHGKESIEVRGKLLLSHLGEQERRRGKLASCETVRDLESARSGRIHKLRRDRLVAAQSLGITREGL